MARIFVTGSTTGVGKNAAAALLGDGHEVILHARNAERAESLGTLAHKAQVLTGDLGDLAEVRQLADALNAIGPMDAIIHNAGIIDDQRAETPDGLLRVLMVNALAPYVLSLLADRPARLIFTGSSMHRGHDGALDDMEWTRRRWSASSAYGESKLLVTALSAGLARRLDAVCYTVDPGWVPTRMGGASASDPLEQAHVTQCWLATGADEEAGYWHHMRRQRPDPKVEDHEFQDAVLDRFAQMTGVPAP
ncbi:SDR family NAD(P)-dependent oxidoreductase [Phaeobacter sp. 22II1-1F12B]|uniref:SDR family NAD(P)-dependent oxidoreductase n=1 Tax=Phaeobacter sp. 22II1-1F12B TaxID=1317111 RepID=UPI000B520711|nr:SDR family NAD(P)-dependent oxidoreductase [Phaeobacter sp. 22II1-1F12B]OWU68319.1 daunorubicin C-13 ketoreductase [Phaeobacter sp. 22II1-1F12B]